MPVVRSVVYRSESVLSNSKDNHNEININKCAESVMNNNQEKIISSTIIAASK